MCVVLIPKTTRTSFCSFINFFFPYNNNNDNKSNNINSNNNITNGVERVTWVNVKHVARTRTHSKRLISHETSRK